MRLSFAQLCALRLCVPDAFFFFFLVFFVCILCFDCREVNKSSIYNEVNIPNMESMNHDKVNVPDIESDAARGVAARPEGRMASALTLEHLQE